MGHSKQPYLYIFKKSNLLRLYQVAKNRFQRIFLPSHSLDTVSSSDMLFCFEVLSKDLAKERVVLLKVQQVKTLFYLISITAL